MVPESWYYCESPRKGDIGGDNGVIFSEIMFLVSVVPVVKVLLEAGILCKVMQAGVINRLCVQICLRE